MSETDEELVALRREVAELGRAKEEALRYEALVEHSGEFIAMAGLDGRIWFVNPAGRALVGLGATQDVTQFVLADFHTEQGLSRATVIKEKGRWEGEGQLRHFQTKELIDVHVTSFLVRSASGEPFGFATVQRDVRDERRLQARVHEMQTLSAIGHLVAGVAHEVRNPLFAIGATLDAMEASQPMTAEQRPFFGALRRELDRVNLLMRDLLEYGKPHRVALVEGPLGPVVATAVRGCEALAHRAGVVIENGVSDNWCVQMDTVRLSQVFVNTLENAIQHAPLGGVIRIEVRSARVEGRDFVEVLVIDSGPGFPPADLSHVFEPFFTRRRGGTGLGLSIVRRIVMDHGGEVVAENRPGGGAHVAIRLPSV